MIAIPEEDIVARRRTADGRFVLFTRTDLPAGWALPWYGVQMDTGGDAVGLLVGLEPATGVWSLQDLLLVAHARALAERDHHHGAGIRTAASRLSYAARAGSGHRTRVRFLPGPLPSAFPWTIAALGEHCLPFCADARAPEDGVTLAQGLVVLDQLLADAVLPAHRQPLFRLLHADVRAALAAVDRP
ncbi:hypothetical protein ACM64Y_10560 [Novispirillum sp. DQ9]|uniref:hypothetical protein n=1 Tax=Novispirillum sp. DQ9 TaxID=3398612 RepID=UPI003C7EBA05